MNQDQSVLTLEESIKEVMRTLPPVIRTYLSQGAYTVVAKSLITKYALRIDQGGILEREIMLLLMGIENPDEFTQALAEEAKLDKKTIEGIAQDINTQIFMPLQEGMKSRMTTPSDSSTSVLLHPRVKNMISRPVTASTPAKIFPHGDSARPIQPVRPPVSNVPAEHPAMIAAPKSGDNRKLLEDHEEPHIEFNKAQTSSILPPAMPPLVPKVKIFTPIFQPGPTLPTPIAPEMQSSTISFATRPPQGINRIVPPAPTVFIAPKMKPDVPTFQQKPTPPLARPSFILPPKVQSHPFGNPRQGDAAPSTQSPASVPQKPLTPNRPSSASGTISLQDAPLPPNAGPTRPYSADPYREPFEEK